MAYKADCAVVLALLKVAFLGKGDDGCMVWATLLSAKSYCRFYARHLSRHLLPPVPVPLGYCLSLEIFPFLSDFTAASTSSRKIGVTSGTVNTSVSPTTVWLYSSAQYSVHLFRVSLVSVRQFPSLSCMVLVFPCFVIVEVLTS